MSQHVWIGRSEKRIPTARGITRPIALSRTFKRTDIAIPTARRAVQIPVTQPTLNFEPDPYVDYGRFLTPEGGILMVYKDLDLRLRHTIWRLVAWAAFTGIAAVFLLGHSPLDSQAINIAALLIGAVINWLIVAKPVEIYRQIEIRPDCMILDGSDIFWRKYMEGGVPSFRPGADGTQVLCGIYGTRFITYLTVRRFDEYDRAPEVLADHLQDAMRQQWTRPPH